MIQYFVELVRYSEIFQYVILFVSGVLSGLLIDMFLDNNSKWWLLRLIFFSALGFMLSIGFTLLIFKAWFHFEPQQESLRHLVYEVYRTQWKETIIIPVFTSIIVGTIMRQVQKSRLRGKIAIVFVMLFSIISNNAAYFANSFKMIQRPQYSAPIEAVTSIINSRLSIYPFVLNGDMLRSIGDGNDLISDNSNDSDKIKSEEKKEHEEPNDFRGYIVAISNNTYAPGMNAIEYLHKAYTLFSKGNHNDDFYCIGMMWNYIYDMYDSIELIGNDRSTTRKQCLDNSIDAYKKCEEMYRDFAGLYSNMAIVYNLMGNRVLTRECIHKALGLSADGGSALSNYKTYIYNWIDDEENDLLIGDAVTVLKYEENLSMYILYGAAAIAENKSVGKAYKSLCEADEYYQGKSAMVKILRLICADLTGADDAFLLPEIYSLENQNENGLTNEEEAYLLRYLFVTNRFDELGGYLAKVGTKDNMELDVQKAAMKACWYLKNPEKVDSDIENVESLRQEIENTLEEGADTEAEDLLRLSKQILDNCLGEDSVDIEGIESDEILDIQYVFLATDSFNNAEYQSAIEYCEAFFDAEKDLEKTDTDNLFSLRQLQPHELMALKYYTQLVFAHSHFEYAKEFRKGSEEWQEHMEKAEEECNAFDQSSKSLFYIGEQFQTLKDNIDMENGKLPENSGETPKTEIEEA